MHGLAATHGRIGGLATSTRHGKEAKRIASSIQEDNSAEVAELRARLKELEKEAANALFVNNTSDTARRAAADRAISSSLGLGEATGSTGAKAKQKKAHGALLAARRGDVKTVAVKGNYNKGSYDFDGEMGAPVSIYGLGQQIKDGTVLERDLYKTKVDDDGNTAPKHGIPRSTMLHWIKDDDLRRKELKFDRGVKGQPHWYVEKFQRDRTALKSSSTVLGAAETRIANHPIQRKQEGRAVPTAGVEAILRNTAIELNAKNPSTKEF